MYNVVIVKVNQSICNLQRELFSFRSSHYIFVEYELVETPTSTKFEHDAWVRSVETNSVSLHQVWMRGNTER
jgi:hypothetical protein